MHNTSAATPSSAKSAPTTPPSQRELVIASLLRGHGTAVKRPGVG